MLNEYRKWLNELQSTLARAAREITEGFSELNRMGREYQKLNKMGRKKLNSETLASDPVQALAKDITGERLPESKYRTGMQKNKLGVTSC